MRLLAYACAATCVVVPALMLAVSTTDPVNASIKVSGDAKRIGPGALYPHVYQVVCRDGRGSAFRVEGGKLLTAEHVTDGGGCSINGEPITATVEPGLDFAIIESPGSGGFKVNCEGIRAGQWFFAVGFARGWQWQTMSQHLSTFRKTKDGLVELIGNPTVIPGMSGGIIMDSAGAAVGIVNRYSPMWPQSFSRQLKDTSLCQRS